MANCCCLNKSKWKKKISSFIWHSKKSGGSSFFFDTLDKQECKFFVFFFFFGLLDKIMRILINEFGEWWWTNQSNMHFQWKTGVSMNLKNFCFVFFLNSHKQFVYFVIYKFHSLIVSVVKIISMWRSRVSHENGCLSIHCIMIYDDDHDEIETIN